MNAATLPNPRPVHTLFEIQPLMWFVGSDGQFPAGPSAFVRLHCYTILLVNTPDRAHPAEAEPLSAHLYFISPGQRWLGRLAADAQGLAVCFSDEFFCLTGDDKDLLFNLNLFHPAYADQPLPVSAGGYAELRMLLTRMQHEFGNTDLLRDTLLRAYLKVVLIHCLRLQQQHIPAVTTDLQPGLFTRFWTLLDAHYVTWKTVQQYADALNVTASHLSERIKKETGLPARDHILRRVTLEAQRLAYFSELSLKEIAHQLGYEDVSYFSKLFKRCNGHSFLHFRQQNNATGSPPKTPVSASH